MKLKYEMTIMEIDGEQMAVPQDCDEEFRGVLRMNGTAADILDKLKEETTEDALLQAMLAEYDAGEEDMRESVHMVLDTLRYYKLLEE